MKAAKSLPVLDQLMDFYAEMTGCSDFTDWLTETGGGACLPQSVFQKLDTTNLNLKAYASNFLNYNRANGGVAAADIDNKFQLRALTTAKNAKKYFDNLIADSQPDKSVPAIVQYATGTLCMHPISRLLRHTPRVTERWNLHHHFL